MNKRMKLLDSVKHNPRDWRMDDLLVLARQVGIECRNHGGSHHVFSYPGVEGLVTVPAHRPIKPVYIRQFLLLVADVQELQR
ncbi:MAG: type II toxin-antitoxin system HicA family toxin [Magnetococcales bacterium]|nr:type II toxin-antitoxin system HicA family toxin [Magnetococcales bacterium]MBF0322883.1 type II toxin-antitoxin system HicA family toxin [Magnetococcales bacterium]